MGNFRSWMNSDISDAGEWIDNKKKKDKKEGQKKMADQIEETKSMLNKSRDIVKRLCDKVVCK